MALPRQAPLSLHQPHSRFWPPLLTIVFHNRSVSAWSSVRNLEGESLTVLELTITIQTDTWDADHGEFDQA